MRILIESTSNSIYKHVKKLQSKSGRTKNSQYLAEGKRLVCDALANDARVEFLVLRRGTEIDFDTGKTKIYEFSEKLFDTLSLTVNSQGIAAVIGYELFPASDIKPGNFETLVYLDSVTDPGNMGTIIRSCDALGADGIIISKGCVDIFNPKVVRSSMASMLNIPIFTDSAPDETFAFLKDSGFEIYGTFPLGDKLCCDEKYEGKVLLVMGNEANGIGAQVEKHCTHKIRIPMFGRAESLNVATALTVMLYEIKRSKSKEKFVNRGDIDG
ncbi:MAG: RNA methyltransferase [Clostridia bacterium]|nr:RNA methyltransferase [Clostridia bacterium]